MEFIVSMLGGADIFTIMLAITILVMLYALTLINNAIRMLQYKVGALEDDVRIISEEIKMFSPTVSESNKS